MDENERYAWIRLALTPYIGAESFLRLIQHYGSAVAALEASASEIMHIACNGKQAAKAWTNTAKAEAATEAALAWEHQEQNCRLMLLCDKDYPVLLTEGLTPPPLLFLRGNSALLARPAVAIVGSRHATPQAKRIASDFGQALGREGMVVVSGMASGIDAAAHKGALSVHGGTVAVWGTGIDRIYPSSHKNLAHEIAENGLVVSEFPLGTRPIAGNFPRRNRIIAALGAATLVVEAAVESGSLITARLAAEMGREVMAVPGSIDNPHSKGCHRLIKEGAKLVENLDDILLECPQLQNKSMINDNKQETIKRKKSFEYQTDVVNKPEENNVIIHRKHQSKHTVSNVGEIVENKHKDVLAYMGYEPIHPDLISEASGISAVDVAAVLLEMELSGQVAALSGGRYQRIA